MFIWRGKLEKLAIQEVFNKLEVGGLGLVDIRSKADSLFIKQCCRILAEPGGCASKHLKYWIGLHLAQYIPNMRPGPHCERVPRYYRHFKKLIMEVFKQEDVDPERLDQVKDKELYKGFTDTFPPPKVVYKHDVPWEKVWERINHPVLEVKQRQLMFMVVHNILPTRESC